jgi:hypothetical protein
MTPDWMEEERGDTNFGDARLAKRFIRLLTDMYDQCRNSIPAACGGWAETTAAYRFFNHSNVDIKTVLSGHYQSSLVRISACDVVLIPQDTTQLIREVTKKNEVIKGIKATEKAKTFLHANIAFTPERVCLGIVAIDHWKREEKKNRAAQAMKPIEEKESVRWLEGYGAACAVQAQCPETLVVSIADRESDIYELFLETQSYEASTKAGWIVRSKHNRPVVDEQSHKLREYLEKSVIKGRTEFTLPANGKRESRKVIQTIQAARIPLKAISRPGQKLEEVEIHAILVKEQDPPKGETPIEWVLLTNLPIDTAEQIETIIKWYICRWEIEIYFRVLKNGCQVQKLQLETIERFEACLGIYLIIAWRLLYMTMLARQCPDLPCDVVLEEAEWQSLYITVKKEPPPETPPTLNDMIDMIAKLGGYLGRNGDGPPGTKTVWIGIQRRRDFTLAINSYKKATACD